MPSPLPRRARARHQIRTLYRDQEGICCYCDGRTWLACEQTRVVACSRLLINMNARGWEKLLEGCRATREHLKRKTDGGRDEGNLKMACHYCNTHRGDSDPDVHRVDMQVMVAAGIHPVNRPQGVRTDDAASHMRRATKALKKLRAGQPIT